MAKWWPFSKPAASVSMDALVVPAGATVLLRTADPLTEQQFEYLKAAFLAETTRTGVKFLALTDAEWQAVVIGAPE